MILSAPAHSSARRRRTSAVSRAGSAPRDVKERGSAGARRPPSDLQQPAAFRRPRAVLCQCRGCCHIVSEPLVPPCRVHRRAYVSGPRATARLERRAAPLRDGRPCKPLPGLHSLDPLPRRLRRACSSQQTDDRIIRRLGQVTRPCPASDAQLLRPSVGQGCAQYGGGCGGGDKFNPKRSSAPTPLL